MRQSDDLPLKWYCQQRRIAHNEAINRARWTHGTVVDRPKVNAHLQSWGLRERRT